MDSNPEPHVSIGKWGSGAPLDASNAAMLAALISELESNPESFSFFQAVRKLDVCFGRQRYPKIGTSLSRSGDPIHFGQRPFMDFAPRTIDLVATDDVEECRFPKPVMLVYFFGLFGPQGVLPTHLTKFALNRGFRRDYAFVNFVNVFHHRFLSFFYRTWSVSRIAPDLDRPDQQRFSRFVGSVIGLGETATEHRDAVFELGHKLQRAETAPEESRPLPPDGLASLEAFRRMSRDWPRLFFSGHLARQVRNAEGLASILAGYFELPIEVVELLGRWVQLPPEDRTCLGSSPRTCSLGINTMVGSKLWNCQMHFRVRMGPLSLENFERMLPGGRSLERLRRWVFHYLGWEFVWDIQLVMDRREVPQADLGSFGRLGWTAFLKSDPFARDPDDLIINPMEVSAPAA
jgi:type VI secretion system protein ImpH